MHGVRYASQFLQHVTIHGLIVGMLCVSKIVVAATLEEQLLSVSPHELLEEARRDGNAERGAAVFYSRVVACATCHSVGDRADSIGPDLTRVDPQSPEEAVIDSVLQPSKTIAKGYATVVITLKSGQQVSGVVIEDSDQMISLHPSTQIDATIGIDRSEIEEIQATGESIMPSGQITQLTHRRHFLDLVRYLLAIREGGAARARELQPPADPFAQQVPDVPLPWRPVVQRGELEVPTLGRFPHAVSIGFASGSIIFDALQLRAVAVSSKGFIESSPQNYFGLYWRHAAPLLAALADQPDTLRIQPTPQAAWSRWEPAAVSDPNVGTRFDGYQVGRDSVRLHFHGLVEQQRVRFTQDVRVEQQGPAFVLRRVVRCYGLPKGGRAALLLPYGMDHHAIDMEGKQSTIDSESGLGSGAILFSVQDGMIIARTTPSDHCVWQRTTDARIASPWSLVSSESLGAEEPVILHLDLCLVHGAADTARLQKVLANVAQLSPMSEAFDGPQQPSRPVPLTVNDATSTAPVIAAQPLRPAVNARENIDELHAAQGRNLRIVITSTNDNAEPGVDELEVYGPGSDENLARRAKPITSSTIDGYAIHQSVHVNDGHLGNEHSWISAEPGKGTIELEFPEPMAVDKLVWARDRTGKCNDRIVVGYHVDLSNDRAHWTRIVDGSTRTPWGAPEISIQRDAAPGYVMERIPPPFPSWRPSDAIFAADGTMYAIAMTEGQVWRTRLPSPEHPEHVEWHRYASGLYHPIGLAIIDSRLFVAQKPEITELVDRDGDGTVDHYRTIATGWGLSTGWHEYCFGLAVDAQRKLWFALNTGYFWTNPGFVNPGRWRGSILRVDPETQQLDIVARGCRVPNGIGVGPNDSLFFTDNQGDWIQSCKVAHIVPGRFYGHPETTADALAPGTYPTGRSSVWLPYEQCRSVSGPVLDTTEGRFGPFAGQLFVGDVGYGANPGIMRIALEQVDGEFQGACMRFLEGQPLGCQRLRFGPDNQLYMTSLTTGLTRVAFTGQTPMSIHSVQIRPGGQGFVIRFTKPLAADAALSVEDVQVKRFHYLYTGEYGSPQADEQAVAVQRVDRTNDGMSITLTLPVETYPIGMVYALNVGTLRSNDGDVLRHPEAWYTVHRIPVEK